MPENEFSKDCFKHCDNVSMLNVQLYG